MIFPELEVQIVIHINPSNAMVIIINHVDKQMIYSNKEFLTRIPYLTFCCMCHLLGKSYKYIYRFRIIHTTGKYPIKVVIIFKNSSLYGATNILRVIFWIWLLLKQFLCCTALVGSYIPIYTGILLEGHSCKGPLIVEVVN